MLWYRHTNASVVAEENRGGEFRDRLNAALVDEFEHEAVDRVVTKERSNGKS